MLVEYRHTLTKFSNTVMCEPVTAIVPLLILCLQADSAQVYIPDVSLGREKRPVSVRYLAINSHSHARSLPHQTGCCCSLYTLPHPHPPTPTTHTHNTLHSTHTCPPPPPPPTPTPHPHHTLPSTHTCPPPPPTHTQLTLHKCVNSLNNEYPDHFEYTTVRTREPNVVISMEPEFLVSCTCTDNCTNRSQCECWQLTIEEARAIGETQHSVGYFHHRLRREQLSAYVFSRGATGSRKHICRHTFVAVLFTGYTMFGKTYYHGSLLVCTIVLAIM